MEGRSHEDRRSPASFLHKARDVDCFTSRIPGVKENSYSSFGYTERDDVSLCCFASVDAPAIRNAADDDVRCQSLVIEFRCASLPQTAGVSSEGNNDVRGVERVGTNQAACESSQPERDNEIDRCSHGRQRCEYDPLAPFSHAPVNGQLPSAVPLQRVCCRFQRMKGRE